MKLELGLPIPFLMLLVIIVPLATHLPILENNILKGLWDFLQVPFLRKFMGFEEKYWNLNAVFLFFLIKNKCNKNYINIYFIPTFIFYTIVFDRFALLLLFYILGYWTCCSQIHLHCKIHTPFFAQSCSPFQHFYLTFKSITNIPTAGCYVHQNIKNFT